MMCRTLRRLGRGGEATRLPATVRRVTFSRNFTLSLSRTCQCYCKYCAFATHRPHLHAPDEVERMLDDAARRGCKELLVLTGERPEVNDEVARAPARLRPRGLHLLCGVGLRARARARAAAALEPRRARPRRPRAAARGERVDGPDAGVGVRAPDGDGARRLADQAPGAAPGDDRGGRASCGSRSPAASWSASARRRTSAWPRSRRWPRCTRRHGHLQEVILQNFVPHPRYHGRRWRTSPTTPRAAAGRRARPP